MKEKLLNVNVEGIFFEDLLGSRIQMFSSCINPNGIFSALMSGCGDFKGVILFNPGATEEIQYCDEKIHACGTRSIIIGLVNTFDEDGNMSSEYFTGAICPKETIIVVRDEKLKGKKVFINPGITEKIKAHIE